MYREKEHCTKFNADINVMRIDMYVSNVRGRGPYRSATFIRSI